MNGYSFNNWTKSFIVILSFLLIKIFAISQALYLLKLPSIFCLSFSHLQPKVLIDEVGWTKTHVPFWESVVFICLNFIPFGTLARLSKALMFEMLSSYEICWLKWDDENRVVLTLECVTNGWKETTDHSWVVWRDGQW